MSFLIKFINIWFYIAAVDIWNFVLMHVQYGRHYHSFSLKKLFTLSGEGVMWVTPILFYETNMNKKWKHEIFAQPEGNKGEKVNWIIFLHSCCISPFVRVRFINLGIHIKFVIANSFSCIFTYYGGIYFDVLIL